MLYVKALQTQDYLFENHTIYMAKYFFPKQRGPLKVQIKVQINLLVEPAKVRNLLFQSCKCVSPWITDFLGNCSEVFSNTLHEIRYKEGKNMSELFLNQRSDRFYNITLVRSFVRHELISETASRIFPKLGMKLGGNKGKKIAEPFFWENFSFCPNLA